MFQPKAPFLRKGAFFIDKYTKHFIVVSVFYKLMSNYLNYIIMVQQNVSIEKAKLLKKARRAFRLSYWFGKYFPEEYLCMAVNLECCSEYGLKVYLMNHGLTKESELLLGENCLTGKLNIQLLLDYIKKYGICDDVLIKAATAENTKVLMEYIEFRKNNYARSCTYFTENFWKKFIPLRNTSIFEWLLRSGCDLYGSSVEEIIKLNDLEMFRIYCQRKPDSTKALHRSTEDILFECGNSEMLDLAFKTFQFSTGRLLALVIAGNEEILKRFFAFQALNSWQQEELIRNGNKKAIALYLSNRPLDRDAQMLLAKKEYKDLLKMHYLKYGIHDDVLAYQANLNNFKNYIGV